MKRRNFMSKTSMAFAGAALIGPNLSYASKNETLKLGVIGTGDRGCGLLSILNEMEGLNVTSCCDVLPFRLEEGIKRLDGKVQAFSDYRKLLESKDVDAVVIATPLSEHYQIAHDALDAGKHVYCEKTMVKGYKDIEKLVKKAKTSKGIFQTGHQYHSSRLYTHVVDLIRNGKIGKITAFECQWNRNGNWRRPVPKPEYERAVNWRMYKEFSGGLLAELCSHQLDFVNWVLGEVPTKVYGDGGIDYWKDGRETFDNVHMIYTYPDGVRSKFTCLTSNAKDDYLIKVLGDKGTITIDYGKAWFYPEKEEGIKEIGEVDGVAGATVQWNQQMGIPIEIEHLDPSKQALLDFKNCIVDNSEPESNIVTGAKTAICVQMGLDALYTGEVVRWKDGLLG